ncbi:MAG: response regulator [Verrucomicrobiia bacterium]
MTHKTVLYVEDEEADVFFVKRAFAHLNVSNPLRVVRNGKDAVDYLAGTGDFGDRQRYPVPSLVLLDLKLPGIQGLDVLAWIREQPQFQSLPVVIFSASHLETDRDRSLQLGANDYVVKPNDMTKVPEFLFSVLNRFVKLDAAESVDP